MKALQRLDQTGSRAVRTLLNGLPTWYVNLTYEAYSRFYEGQIRLGLPVSRKLLQSEEEKCARAAAKLALSLYHIFFHVTGVRFSRREIKSILLEDLARKRIRLTEDVILLTRRELATLARERLHIDEAYLPSILSEAMRRRILRETLRPHRMPAYFESTVEEKDQNGRGDYEIVTYRDYTDEGKSLAFRRLASMEAVTAGDSRPSVLLAPGIGCNSNCFDLASEHSLARDLADRGCWVYLFDPRGTGVNKAGFDPLCTVDTLIDYDLATVARFIYRRSRGKPMVLIGHSMGGMIAEAMVLNWGLRRHFHRLTMLSRAQRDALDRVLPPRQTSEACLSMIRGVITLGAPKFFQKDSHLLFPLSLWLNHLSRILRLRYVPFREAIWLLTRLPLVRKGTQALVNSNVAHLNFLFNPINHSKDRTLPVRFLERCGESIPLGLGFQFLKAIYNGEGFKRMDGSRLNYSELIDFFPEEIPVFHFWGKEDSLAPPDNLRYSPRYPHAKKSFFEVASEADLDRVVFSSERSQLVDVLLAGASHVDLLFGQCAEKLVVPLLSRAVDAAWADWSYPGKSAAA